MGLLQEVEMDIWSLPPPPLTSSFPFITGQFRPYKRLIKNLTPPSIKRKLYNMCKTWYEFFFFPFNLESTSCLDISSISWPAHNNTDTEHQIDLRSKLDVGPGIPRTEHKIKEEKKVEPVE